MQQLESQRVGYVVKRYPRYSETFIVNEILAHEAAGLDVEIFSLHGPCDTHFQDIISRVRAPVTYLPERVQRSSDFWTLLRDSAAGCPGIVEHLPACIAVDARDVAQAAALARFVLQRGITHLHAHFATSATTVARLAAMFAGIGYSFTAHAKDIFHESVDYTELGVKMQQAQAVVTVSDFNYGFLTERFPAAAARLHRIYNGLDLQRFAFESPRNRPPMIVSCGRLVEKKGFEYLIRACAELSRRSVEFHCQIIGSGELEASLRQMIADLQLDAQVEMLGARPQRDVIESVRNAAVFAAPCIVGEDGNRDGLPTVLLEAMALGTPCIGTDVTGIPEAIIDNRTGILVGQRDTEALADQIERLLRQPELRERIADRARDHIEQLFDIDSNASRVRSVFSGQPSLISERRSA